MTEREAFESWAREYGYDIDEPYDPAHADAWLGWSARAARAQPAQAVPASCGECGKKTSDGWALYCVACMEKAGLPAQAVPLTDAEIDDASLHASNEEELSSPYRIGYYAGARWGEAAVRAKLGVAVPMTDPHLQTSEERRATGERIASMIRVEEVGADLIRRARDIVVGHQRGSISLVQRRLQISYNTAAKLLEALEQEGVVSPQRQNGQREVLVLPDISGIVGKEGA